MAMAAKTTALQASRARRPPLHCHRGLCCFKSPSRKTGKGILRNLSNTQESRGGLTPRQHAIPRQGGYLRTEDAAGRQQKGFPMITRRNCLIGASAALIGAPAIVRAGNVMAIRGVPVQRAYYGFCDRLRIDCL